MGQDQLPSDEIADIQEICKEVIDQYPKYVELHRISPGAALGFLMPKVIKELGACDYKTVVRILKQVIDAQE